MGATRDSLARIFRVADDGRLDHAGLHGAADVRAMREANSRLILNRIRLQGPLARVAIAASTGLSRTTVSSIVNDLLDEGLVREGDLLKASPSGGRRAMVVHFNASAAYLLGVDVGRTHVIILATDLAANHIATYSGPFDTEQGPEASLRQLTGLIWRFVAEHHLAWDRVVGVGVAIPGPLDAERRMLVAPPRMPGWDQFDIKAALERALEVPMYVDNDANMGALGEGRFGAGRGVPHFVYSKVGTGIGCGIVINGVVYRGCSGTAGEMGHFTVAPDGPRCDCGNQGCLEACASAPYVVHDAANGWSWRDEAPPLDYRNGASASHEHDVADVVRAALRGDLASQAAIRKSGDRVGIALAGLVNLLNPSLILLDGSVARAGELFLDPIRAAIAARSLRAATASVAVRLGELGDHAIALGAIATSLDAVFGIQRSLSLASGMTSLAAT